MILSSDVTVTSNIDAQTARRITRLFCTPAGSIPFDRAFGVDPDVLDDAPSALEGALLVEYASKLRRYFPGLYVKDLTFSSVGNSVTPRVVIAHA